MPKIGQRIIKSAAAVFLCFMIDMLRGDGIPFYSAIAAILCMQRDLSDSRAKGKSRMIATFIGGIAGMGMLYITKLISIDVNTGYHYALIAFALIPLIYCTVLMKQPDCTYLSCVVFLCICISHGNDENPFLFAFNRMLDTWIGILVALGVNAFHLPHHIYKNICIDIPLSYLTTNNAMSNYMQHYLNRFTKEGLQLIITSSKTPAQLNQCIPISFLPSAFYLLDGALFYDRNHDSCRAQCEISYELWTKLYQVLSASKFQPFLYEICDNRLYIHHLRTMDKQESEFYQDCLLSHENHFVLHDRAMNECFFHSCIMLELLIKKEMTDMLYQLLKAFVNEITWVSYEENASEVRFRIYPIQLIHEVPLKCFHNHDIKRIRYLSKPKEKQLVYDIKQMFYYGKY